MKDLRWSNKHTTRLFEAILSLHDISECQDFFRDLFSLREMHWMSRRWLIAYMLKMGFPHSQIRQMTGAGFDTIMRVNYWLNHGMGGFERIMRRKIK